MMRKRNIRREDNDKDRWLVSYADFMTLLFVVFIVLYAVANINLEYYKDLLRRSNIALMDSNGAPKALSPKEKQPSLSKQQLAQLREKLQSHKQQYKKYVKDKRDLQQMSQSLEGTLQKEIKTKAVTMHKHEDWFSIELKSLFPSASAFPKETAYPVLAGVADSLRRTKNKISVQGYTDNVPIENDIFPSNWELSAARAAAVVRVLVDYGVEPTQLSATGYGKLYPVASNETEAGRLRNRRIVIMIAVNANVMNKLHKNLATYDKVAGEKADIDTKNIKIKTGDHQLPSGSPKLPADQPAP